MFRRETSPLTPSGATSRNQDNIVHNKKKLGLNLVLQDQFMEGEGGEVDLEMLALMLGVEKVTKRELKNFKRSLKSVEPREVEGFGFGKLHGN